MLHLVIKLFNATVVQIVQEL